MSFSCSAILGFQFVVEVQRVLGLQVEVQRVLGLQVEVQRVLGLQVEAQAWAGPPVLALGLVQLEQERVEPKGL